MNKKNRKNLEEGERLIVEVEWGEELHTWKNKGAWNVVVHFQLLKLPAWSELSFL